MPDARGVASLLCGATLIVMAITGWRGDRSYRAVHGLLGTGLILGDLDRILVMSDDVREFLERVAMVIILLGIIALVFRYRKGPVGPN